MHFEGYFCPDGNSPVGEELSRRHTQAAVTLDQNGRLSAFDLIIGAMEDSAENLLGKYCVTAAVTCLLRRNIPKPIVALHRAKLLPLSKLCSFWVSRCTNRLTCCSTQLHDMLTSCFVHHGCDGCIACESVIGRQVARSRLDCPLTTRQLSDRLRLILDSNTGNAWTL